MSIQLCLLFSALAFVSLSMIFDEPQQYNLFPYVPLNITKTTFPIDLQKTTASDMVLVKCPDKNYKHKTINDIFIENFTIDGLFKKRDRRFSVKWIPLVLNSSESKHIKCGEIIIRGTNATHLNHWTFNIIPNNTATIKDMIQRVYIKNSILFIHKSCNDIPKKDIIILTKKKNGDIVEVKDVYRLDETYVNQMFYYFEKPEETEKIKEPCGIVKAFSTPPKITLPGFEPEEIEGVDISFVHVEDKTMNVAVELKVGRDTSYYLGEKISLTRMRYLEEGLSAIDNSTISITSNFTIKGFEIVKLTYNGSYEKRDYQVTKIYYFGPKAESFKSEKTVIYSENKNTDKLNCTVYWKNIGYLKEIVYKKDPIIYKHFQSTNNKTKKVSKYEDKMIFLKDIDRHSGTLECIYQTPRGIITKLTKFAFETKPIPIFDEDRNTTYSDENRQSNVVSKMY